MTADAPIAGRRRLRLRFAEHPESIPYELFIAVITAISMVVTVLIFLPSVQQVQAILEACDTILCVIFLLDVGRSAARAPTIPSYFLGSSPGRSIPFGLIELAGSIPGLYLLRFLRLVRLIHVREVVGRKRLPQLVAEFFRLRAETAAYVIIVVALLVLLIGSSLVVSFEAPFPGSNIKTGGEAIWWAFVTVATVGYGDFYPVSPQGRFVGVVMMATGIGIFGVLTSYLAKSFLTAPSTAPVALPEPGRVGDDIAEGIGEGSEPTAVASAAVSAGDPLADEIRAIRAQLDAMQRTLDRLVGDQPG
jgi:voltage-gated potassium channel